MVRIIYVNNEERTFSMLCHLSALAMFMVPFGNIFGPLLVWMFKKDQYAEVNRQGKDALNFQISILIYTLLAVLLMILLVGFLLLVAIGLFNLIIIIIATVKSNNGERFEYPLTINIIS